MFGVSNYYTIIYNCHCSNTLFSNKAKYSDLIPKTCQLALLWPNATICTCHPIYSGRIHHLKPHKQNRHNTVTPSLYTCKIYVITNWGTWVFSPWSIAVFSPSWRVALFCFGSLICELICVPIYNFSSIKCSVESIVDHLQNNENSSYHRTINCYYNHGRRKGL